MNIKSFFNTTVLKKDLTRFWPVWAVYLLVGLLLTVSRIVLFYHETDIYQKWEVFHDFMRPFGLVMCVYAVLIAQLLFGDLFSGRLSTAVHALPVRREGLFLTHYTAGLIMGIGPNVIFALVIMASMGRHWGIALPMLGMIALQYLFFFGIAVFCIMCTGNWLASTALYGLVNMAAVVVMWFYETLFLPKFYGLQIADVIQEKLYLLSPVWTLTEAHYWFRLPRCADCNAMELDCPHTIPNILWPGEYSFGSVWQSVWFYLILTAAIGLVLSIAALLIYRKRPIENTGDFIVFKPIGLLFTVLGCFSLGSLCYLFMGKTPVAMVIGLVLGFFICRILLERTIKVFHKKTWIRFGIFSAVIVLLFGVSYTYGFSVVRHIPDSNAIDQITISVKQYRYFENIADYGTEKMPEDSHIVLSQGTYFHPLILTETEQIDDFLQIHQLLIDEGDPSQREDIWDARLITVYYKLKNGDTLIRRYISSSISKAVCCLEGHPRLALCFQTPEDMLQYTKDFRIYSKYDHDDRLEDPIWIEKLIKAMFEDVEAGRMGQTEYTYGFSLSFGFVDRGTFMYEMTIPKEATASMAWLEEYATWYEENKKN